MTTFTFIASICGVVFGAVGMILGILNTLRIFDRDRVHLLVTPTHGYDQKRGPHLGVRIVNRSIFHVSIAQISFKVYTQRPPFDEFVSFVQCNGVEFPYRMDERTSVDFTFPREAFTPPDFGQIIGLEVITSCGVTVAVPWRRLRPMIESVVKLTTTASGDRSGDVATKTVEPTGTSADRDST